MLPLAAAMYAQTNATDAALDGFVTDEQGSAVRSAKVVARNTNINTPAETLTNDDGYFRFPLLKIGAYELSVTAPGFTEFRQTGIQLRVSQQARINIPLKVGAVIESVTVTADAAMVDVAGQQAQGEVMNERAVRNLPMTSRNVYNFHLLGPGVKGIPSTGFGTTQFLFGGHNRSTWSVDGLDNSQRRFNRQIRLVISTPEAVEEMQVMSGAYSAEFGRAAGGIINVVTRSGTNDLHGGGMWFYRPSDTAARPPLSATKPEQTWWMVAANVSGPLKRDRMWFFLNDEYNPLKAPSPVTIAPAAAQAIGLPSLDLGNSPFGETFHTPSAKLNYRLSDKNTGFLRYNRFTNDQPGGGGGLTAISRSLTFEDRMNGGAAQLATVFSPTLMNEIRFGINRRSEIRNTYVPGEANGAAVNITGVANFGVNPLAANEAIETSTQFIDNLTWTAAKHTIKTGADFQMTDYKVRSALDRTYTFGGLAAAAQRPAVTPLDHYLRTVRGETDPATGRPYTYTQLAQQLGDRDLPLRFNFFNAFVQDEWRAARNFTLNFGIRYELLKFPTLDSEAPNPLSRKINTDGNNFAPRIGFSYSPGKSSRTVIRGGYGIFYDTTSLNLVLTAAQVNGRRVLSYTIPGTDAQAPRFGQSLTAGSTAFRATPPDLNVFPADFQTMLGHNATMQVEREVVRDLSVNVQYAYWGHRFAPYARDINLSAPVRTLEDGRPVYQGSAGRPDTRFRRVLLIESGSNSNYNALDVTIRKRFARGVQFSTTWSWSHALSDSDMQGNPVMDPSNRRRDYGNSNGDVRHNWIFQGLYSPEFKLLRGFQFATVVFVNSGFPVNALAGTDLNNDLTLNDRLPGRGRNLFQGPAFFQTDVRLSRRIRIREKHSIELLAESENFFNRLNASCSIEGCTGAVVNRDGAADFLRITGSRPGRQFQFGMRYMF